MPFCLVWCTYCWSRICQIWFLSACMSVERPDVLLNATMLVNLHIWMRNLTIWGILLWEFRLRLNIQWKSVSNCFKSLPLAQTPNLALKPPTHIHNHKLHWVGLSVSRLRPWEYSGLIKTFGQAKTVNTKLNSKLREFWYAWATHMSTIDNLIGDL